jgi:hypothetical protein
MANGDIASAVQSAKAARSNNPPPPDPMAVSPSQGMPAAVSQLLAASPAMLTQPSTPPDFDAALQRSILEGSQQGQQILAEQIARSKSLGQQETALSGERAGMPLPKTSVLQEPWMKMQPVTGQGFGRDAKNLALDVLRGALSGVASTGPGRSVQAGIYGPGERRFATRQDQLANQIADVQKQREEADRLAGTGAQMVYRPLMPGARTVQTGVTKELGENRLAEEKRWHDMSNAEKTAALQQRRADSANRLQVSLGNLKARWAGLNEAQRHNAVDESIAQQRTDDVAYYKGLGLDEKSANDYATQHAKENKLASDHYIQSWFGTLPGGASASPRSAPPSARQRSGSQGGSVKVTDPRGGIHTFPDQRSADNFKRAAGIR